MSTARPLKVLLVGAGPMGRHHARAVQWVTQGLSDLVGIVDPDARALEEATAGQGVPGFEDLDRALSTVAPDVVHVCVPPRFHAPVALQALEARAHLYVEKPFTLKLADAQEILDLARENGLLVAAGHQLLVDRTTELAEAYLAGIGEIRYVESYFASEPLAEVSGSCPRSPMEEILEILPHPASLLAHFLESRTGVAPELRWLEASERGWVQVAVRSGSAAGSLFVTLEGRPGSSSVRIVGSRGTVYLDYLRGLVVPKLWDGSELDEAVEPYHEAGRLAWGSIVSLGHRTLRREQSYPGLPAMFEAFYRAIRGGGLSPVPPGNILFSVDLLERVGRAIADTRVEYRSPASPATVVVTGGSGFLGREVVTALLDEGETPLFVGRHLPPEHQRIESAHYAVANLAEPETLNLPPGVRAVIHCAAESAGSWEAHQRNSVDATRHLLEASAEAGVERFLHVSSLSVVSLGAEEPIGEGSLVEEFPRARGPHVWGKLEAERLITDLGSDLGLETRILRPGFLMNRETGPLPGRLGLRVGPLLIAFGPGRARVPTTDVKMAAAVLAAAAAGRIDVPKVLHLLDREPPTRRELVAEEKRRRRGTLAIWVPWLGIRLLSRVAAAGQMFRRPGVQIQLADALKVPRYETQEVAKVLVALESGRRSISGPSS